MALKMSLTTVFNYRKVSCHVIMPVRAAQAPGWYAVLGAQLVESGQETAAGRCLQKLLVELAYPEGYSTPRTTGCL